MKIFSSHAAWQFEDKIYFTSARIKDLNKKKRKKPILILITAVILLMAAVTGIAYKISTSDKSFPNLYVDSIPVGKLAEREILSRLKQNGWQGIEETVLSVETFNAVTEEINPVDSGAIIDCETAARKASEFGKDGNIFSCLVSYIKCLFKKTDINELNSSFNDDYINGKIDSLQSSLDESFSYDSFSINEDDNTLVILKGYGKGLKLDKNKLKENILSALQSRESNLTFYDLSDEPGKPDFSALYDLVCKEPEDACFSSDGSHTVIEGKPGYTFDITQAEKLWEEAEPGEEIKIPLEAHYSDVTAEYLESMMYKHLLGAMTTKYNNSGENRCSNVRLAASLVDGTVIFPGEEFSFNETVGKRTEEAGFLYAPAYAGYDDIQEEIGGGVCQVSTGIYASALFAFLEVTSHTCHVYPPNYIQLGTDATVSIPESGREIDLKILNSKNWPVKIIAYCEEGENSDTGKPLKTVTVEIWGTLEDDDYMPVEFDNAWGDVYDYDRKIEPAYSDRPGYRIQFTHDETEFEDDTGKGLRTLTYRRVYDSEGNVVEKKILNKEYSFGYGMDTYYYKQ